MIMRKRNVIITLLFILTSIHVAKAQIGYQVSLLNTATGEARANETVTVTVSLSNSAGEIFYSETKQSTTNDFGVLSLTVGNVDTFKNVDLSKMPFYIEVTANGVMIGKSQMLSVPVAEVARQMAPIDVVGRWQRSEDEYITFFNDGTGLYYRYGDTYSLTYIIEGSFVLVHALNEEETGRARERYFIFLLINGSLFRVYYQDDSVDSFIKQ